MKAPCSSFRETEKVDADLHLILEGSLRSLNLPILAVFWSCMEHASTGVSFWLIYTFLGSVKGISSQHSGL